MKEDNYQPEILAVNKINYDVVGMPLYNVESFMWGQEKPRAWTFLIYVGDKVRAFEPNSSDVTDIQAEVDMIIDLMHKGVI